MNPTALAELLEKRRQRVASVLANFPERKYAHHIAGASPKGIWPFGGPVSVVIALRDSSGGVVTGELTVPLALWEESALLAYLEGLEVAQVIKAIGQKACAPKSGERLVRPANLPESGA